MTPGGPRTLLGESGRGMGTQELRPEAGKSLPLGHLSGGPNNPELGSALGTFWLNRENQGCSPSPGPNQSIQGLCV